MKAATQLASGHRITDSLALDEITIFLLMKEFGGTPGQWRREASKDIKFLTTILSTYNRVTNEKMERSSKGKKAMNGPRSTGKFMREEKVGPEGIEIIDTPI